MGTIVICLFVLPMVFLHYYALLFFGKTAVISLSLEQGMFSHLHSYTSCGLALGKVDGLLQGNLCIAGGLHISFFWLANVEEMGTRKNRPGQGEVIV